MLVVTKEALQLLSVFDVLVTATLCPFTLSLAFDGLPSLVVDAENP